MSGKKKAYALTDEEYRYISERLKKTAVKLVRARNPYSFDGRQAVVLSGNGRISSSYDEMGWTTRLLGGVPKFFTDFDYREDTQMFLAVGKAGALATSFDGGQWVERVCPLRGDLILLPASDPRGKWVVQCGDDVAASNDGIIWA